MPRKEIMNKTIGTVTSIKVNKAIGINIVIDDRTIDYMKKALANDAKEKHEVLVQLKHGKYSEEHSFTMADFLTKLGFMKENAWLKSIKSN